MSTTITTPEVEIVVRAWAFSGQNGIHKYRFLVRGNEVKVWDEIAGYYTNCNAMSVRAKKRIVKLALAGGAA